MNPKNRWRSRSANDDGDTVRPSIETLLKAKRLSARRAQDLEDRSPLVMKRTSIPSEYPRLPSHPIYDVEEEEMTMNGNRVQTNGYIASPQNGYQSRRHTTGYKSNSDFQLDNMASMNEVLHQLRLIVLPLQKEISSLRQVTRDLQHQVSILQYENMQMQKRNDAQSQETMNKVKRTKSKNLCILMHKQPALRETYSTDDEIKTTEVESSVLPELEDLSMACSTDTMIRAASFVTESDALSVNTASLFQGTMSRNTSDATMVGLASPRNVERINRLDETIKNSARQFQKEQEALDFERIAFRNQGHHSQKSQNRLLDENREVLLRDVSDSPLPDVSQITHEYSGMSNESVKSDSTRITCHSDASGGSKGQTPEYMSYAPSKYIPYLSVTARGRGIGALAKTRM